jgi:hypothetical protein
VAKEKALPKGFNCHLCGKWHDFPSYVFAHWDEVLTFTCPVVNCGAKCSILRGNVTPIRPSMKAGPRNKK